MYCLYSDVGAKLRSVLQVAFLALINSAQAAPVRHVPQVGPSQPGRHSQAPVAGLRRSKLEQAVGGWVWGGVGRGRGLRCWKLEQAAKGSGGSRGCGVGWGVGVAGLRRWKLEQAAGGSGGYRGFGRGRVGGFGSGGKLQGGGDCEDHGGGWVEALGAGAGSGGVYPSGGSGVDAEVA